MDIKSFRIKNYRSIKDSGECFLSGDNITILAGKNESGKTAILEALEDFNTEEKIREEATPIHNKDVVPEITITFELDNAILKEISNEINYRLKTSKSINIDIIKKYPAKYSLSEESITSLALRDESVVKRKQKEIKQIYNKISNIHSDYPEIGDLPDPKIEELSNFDTQIKHFKKQIQPNITQIVEEKRQVDLTELINEIIEIIKEIDNLKLVEEKFISEIKK